MSFPGDVRVEFYRANKDYTCSCCRGSIRKNDRYAREATFLDRIQVWPHIRAYDEVVVCLECSIIALVCAHPELPWYMQSRYTPKHLLESGKYKPKKSVYFAEHRMEKLWTRAIERLRFS
jgi:hypothetical protein